MLFQIVDLFLWVATDRYNVKAGKKGGLPTLGKNKNKYIKETHKAKKEKKRETKWVFGRLVWVCKAWCKYEVYELFLLLVMLLLGDGNK